MAAATPAPSNAPSNPGSPVTAQVTQETQPAGHDSKNVDSLVLSYLHQRGHKGAEKALREALGIPSPPLEGGEDDRESVEPPQQTVSDAELRKHLVPFWQKDGAGKNALADSDVTMQGLMTGGVTTPSVASLLKAIGPGGADEILSLDPTDRHEGFKDLENWVEGSLDMYRVRAACRQLLKSCIYHSRSLNSDQYYIPYSAIFTSTS